MQLSAAALPPPMTLRAQAVTVLPGSMKQREGGYYETEWHMNKKEQGKSLRQGCSSLVINGDIVDGRARATCPAVDHLCDCGMSTGARIHGDYSKVSEAL